MRLLLFSDVHHDLGAARRLVEMGKDADAAVGAGDFAARHRGLEETIAALAALSPAVVVPGNNETAEALTSACAAAWPSARVCHGAGVEVGGQSFFGLGGGIPPTPWDWSFDLDEADAEAHLAACPAGAVLVVHSPPLGFLDGTGADHLGSRAVLEAVRAKRPALVVCGHIHDCWGQEAEIDGTRVVNPGPRGRLVEV